MPVKFFVTVERFDAHGNYTREKLPLNEAVLDLLRFARKYPNAHCTVAMHEIDPPLHGVTLLNPLVRITPTREPAPNAAGVKTDSG